MPAKRTAKTAAPESVDESAAAPAAKSGAAAKKSGTAAKKSGAPAKDTAAAAKPAKASPPVKKAPKDVRSEVEESTAAVAAEAEGDEATEEAAVPLNRAERRAKGKGSSSAQPTSRGKVVGGKGPASTHRMWANRRSG
jgi:hypothetical protein